MVQVPANDSLGIFTSPFVTDLYGTLESIATIAALAIAGWWTWRLFVKQRVSFAKLELTHSLMARQLEGGKVFVHLTVTVKNVGAVLVQIRKLSVWLQQVAPLTPESQVAIATHNPLSVTGDPEIEWPLIAERQRTWGPGRFEIEPGETDDESFDFVVDGPLEVVRAYTTIPNDRKNTGVGWSETTTIVLIS